MWRGAALLGAGCCLAVGGWGSLAAAEILPGVEMGDHRLEPLAMRDRFPLTLSSLDLEPVRARPLAAGRWRLTAELTLANTFARTQSVEKALEARDSRGPLTLEELRELAAAAGDAGVFYADGELVRLALQARRGLSRGWELQVVLPAYRLGGGFLDGFVEGFHELVGRDQDGRLGVDRRRFLLFLGRGDRELFVGSAPGAGLGDLQLAAKRSLGTLPLGVEVAVRGVAELPTGDEEALLSSGSLDVSAQLLADRCGELLCFYASLAYTRLGEWELLGLPSRDLVAGFLGVQRIFRKGRSLQLQVVGSRSPLGELEMAGLSEAPFEWTVGWRQTWPGGRSLVVGLTENLFHFNNGADFSVHLTVSHEL